MVLEFYLTVRTNKFSPLSPPNLVLNVPIPPNQTASAFLTNKSATFPTSPNPTVLCQVGTNVGTRLALGHLNFGRLSHSLAKVGAAAGAHLVGVFGLDDARRASALDDGW